MNVVWSPLALEKLGDAAEFISLDDPVAAENWVNDVFDKTELLGTMPEMGRLVPELHNPNYREIIFGNYRIIYSIGLEIQILTIRNCRQILTKDDV
ncbi:type II toxin-antitoxin system RelE/ParE family toxin [Vibrio tritonius]|uniref:Type II toxin-antitoxin system RelE/ParE family toxin n=1 Tax=Vibrio tritonius TaxID=1435069 RepID=A0ABS7YS37_9VIBR|nr:type II toxin-antitoxin system RelE/ParE family toxin [Vibrio tritonius]MCA2017049.1 type II toxin-antitoxin system RelE/ParE family toxin [Vibrio tritonius]